LFTAVAEQWTILLFKRRVTILRGGRHWTEIPLIHWKTQSYSRSSIQYLGFS
jgi:hypothetical protein